jgi:hypothetical protein
VGKGRGGVVESCMLQNDAQHRPWVTLDALSILNGVGGLNGNNPCQ